MYCLICIPVVKLKEVKQYSNNYDTKFYAEYICPQCLEEHICWSQSGDMVQDNLDLKNK